MAVSGHHRYSRTPARQVTVRRVRLCRGNHDRPELGRYAAWRAALPTAKRDRRNGVRLEKNGAKIPLTMGQKYLIPIVVNGAEFLRRIKKIGKSKNVTVTVDTKQGKGSHGTLHYGDGKTILKDRKKEIGQGLLAAMLDQLGISKSDFDKE